MIVFEFEGTMAMALENPSGKQICMINVNMFGSLAQPFAFFARLRGGLLDRSNTVYINLKYDYG